jgi:uncharacterized membrane protein
MTQLGLFGTIVGLAVWLGAVVFLSTVVTPAMSRRLGPGKASELLAVVNRHYSWISWASGALMLVGGVAPLAHPEQKPTAVIFIVLTACALAVAFYWGLVVVPRSNDLRNQLQGSAGADENLWLRDRFDHMYRFAAFLNVLVMCLLVGAAFALSWMFVPSPIDGG